MEQNNQLALKEKLYSKEAEEHGNQIDFSEEILSLLEGKIDSIELNPNAREELKQELYEQLDEELIGQEEAKKSVIDAIINNISSLRTKEGPLGVFFLTGNTGIGKTELAKALGKVFLGNKNAITRIECDAYQESHTSRNLFGAPKSYVGFGEPTPLNDTNLFKAYKNARNEGMLHPEIKYLQNFSILVFDEIEKAHPNIHQGLLSIMNEGKLQFPTGREENTKCNFSSTTDFSNTIIIMTSNIGTKELHNQKNNNPIGFGNKEDNKNNKQEEEKKIIKKSFKDFFSPEFIGRIDEFIPFHSLENHHCEQIIQREIKDINRHFGILEGNLKLEVDKDVIQRIIKNGYSDKYGARSMMKFFGKTLESDINNIINSDQLEETFQLGEQYCFVIKPYMEEDTIKYSLHFKEKSDFPPVIPEKYDKYIKIIENLSFINHYKYIDTLPENENIFTPLPYKGVKKLIDRKIKNKKGKMSYEDLLETIEEIEILISGFINQNKLSNEQTKEIIKIVDMILKS